MAVVKFEDVATRVNTKEDRHNTDLVYYIGGDHIDSESLKVSKRGIIKGAPLGPMFYFGFKPGDILFVTRNPHLRKCAVVDFAGICSEKTFVIATKDETVLCQKYLAGVMQSDDFWDFLEENKSGSVNYFINWSTLAEYEFDLPPIEEQRALAEKLWAANDLKEKYQNLLAATDEMLKAKFREAVDAAMARKRFVKLGDVVSRGRPICYGILMPGEEVPGGVPVIKVKDFPDGVIHLDALIHTSKEIDEDYKRSSLLFGDLILSIRGTVGRVAEVPEELNGANITQDTARITVDPKYNAKYIRGVLESAPLQEEMMLNMRGVAIKGINIGFLRELLIPMSDRATQDQLAQISTTAEASKAELKKSIASIDAVMKGLING